MIPGRFEDYAEFGEPLCNEPEHDVDCDCGADPDRVYEERAGK